MSKKYTGIEVRLDGERVGELSRATSQKISPIVQLWAENGNTTAALATMQGSSLAVDLSVGITPASEMSDDDLDPPLCPLPELVPFEPDPSVYEVPDAWQGKQRKRRTHRVEPTSRRVSEPPQKDPDDIPDSQQYSGAPSAPTPESPQAETGSQPESFTPVEEPVNTPNYLSDPPRINRIPDQPSSHAPSTGSASRGVIKAVKYVLAGAATAWGALCVLVGITALELWMLCSGAAFLLPGAWFFLHERRDRRATPLKRHWGLIALASFVLLWWGYF